MFNKNLPDKWKILNFSDCIEKVTASNKLKVPKKDYLELGDYPIIDQSVDFIAGYTNDAEKVFQGELPIIIFGDHTRIFKYIDFPFSLGADGTKIIIPKKELFNVKYLYYFLKGLKIEDHGYDRHYKYLKNKKIVISPIETQKKIVEILEKAEKLKEWRAESDELADGYLRSVFLEMFGDPEINSNNWEIKNLEKLIKEGSSISYGIVQPGDEFKNGIGVVRPVDIINNKLIHNNIKKVDPEIEKKYKRTKLDGNEILITVRGTTGNTALSDEKVKWYNVTRGIAVIKPNLELINIFYLNEFLKSDFASRYIQGNTKGATLKQINIRDLKVLPILLSPITLQNQFAQIVQQVETLKTHQAQSKQEIDNLFNTLMQKAFKGELVC
jgi:type I restriction enzyme S subunit